MNEEPRGPTLRLPLGRRVAVAVLVLLAMVIGVLFGLPMLQRSAALQAIRRAGGSYKVNTGVYPSVKVLGLNMPRFSGKVESIGLHGRATDQILGKVAYLSETSELIVTRSKITEKGLQYIGTMSGLEKLDLTDTRITNDGLAHLVRLPRLQEIRFYTPDTDAACVHLGRIKSLRKLNLASMPISDAGLQYLSGLSNLEELSLGHRVTNAGLVHLKWYDQTQISAHPRHLYYRCRIAASASSDSNA